MVTECYPSLHTDISGTKIYVTVSAVTGNKLRISPKAIETSVTKLRLFVKYTPTTPVHKVYVMLPREARQEKHTSKESEVKLFGFES